VIASILLAAAATVASSADDEAPRVEIATDRGTFVVELFVDRAPATVENFLRYVEDGFYDRTVFHRVIPGFMIQCGGFDQNLAKKPTRAPIENEADNGVANRRGTLAMARTGDPHSATAQFFVNLVDNAYLDHRGRDAQGWGYAVFGRVVAGMETVDAIAGVPTGTRAGMQNVPLEPVVIEKARRVEPPPNA